MAKSAVPPRRSGWVAGIVAVLVAAALTACTSATATFESAAGQGVAAVETARLAIDLDERGRAFHTVTLTTLDDARRELLDAVTTVAETDATTEADAATRTDLLDALDLGVAGVNDARDAINGVGTLDDAALQLDASADALRALEAAEASDGGAG